MAWTFLWESKSNCTQSRHTTADAIYASFLAVRTPSCEHFFYRWPGIRDDVLCIRFLNAGGGCAVGSTSGRNIVTLLWLCSQVSTLSNSSRRSLSTFCRICCGRFLPSPPKIGCMSLFKYCKGFFAQKVIIIKKKNILTPTFSLRWRYTITYLLYTFLLSLGIPCWSSARTINLSQKANSTISKNTNKSLNRQQEFTYSSPWKVQSKASANTRP